MDRKIVIYQMGKVGSTTLKKAFLKRFPQSVFPVHSHKEAERLLSTVGACDLFTGVREPLSR